VGKAPPSLAAIQEPVRERLDAALDEVRRIIVSDFPMIEEVNDYLLLMRGKMFRPTLLLLANESGDLRFSIPQEGSLQFIDGLAIPGNAGNVPAAYRFIDYLLKPENAVRNARASHFLPSLELDQEGNRRLLPELSGQLRVAGLEEAHQRARRQRLAHGVHLGELAAAAKDVDELPALALGAAVLPRLVEDDGPGHGREEQQNQQDGFRQQARTEHQADDVRVKLGRSRFRTGLFHNLNGQSKESERAQTDLHNAGGG